MICTKTLQHPFLKIGSKCSTIKVQLTRIISINFSVYSRKCSITGEKTLPVLEAAHIKPYSALGPHSVSNGLLLRSDMHKLFDSGYLTITTDLKIEVSSRIKEEFQNGKEYYKYHGNNLFILPSEKKDLPNSSYIDWHNTNIYKS
ncbi:MAG: HNH endonuclease [Sphingobacteriaceae bacterium]|nr:MAG: HNH endonuclease [Sphingobacteriaceae bacterium]